jgi:hypothetical protein
MAIDESQKKQEHAKPLEENSWSMVARLLQLMR